MLSTELVAALTFSSVYMVTSLTTGLMRAQISTRAPYTIHLSTGSRVINDLTTEVLEFSMELDKRDIFSQRVKEEMKWESSSGFNIYQLNLCNACARAMSCTISIHYCRKVDIFSSLIIAESELNPSPASSQGARG